MKKMFISLLLIFSATFLHGQLLPDSVMYKYRMAKTGSDKGRVLYNYVRKSMPGTPVQKIPVFLTQSGYFNDKHDETGFAYSQYFISDALWDLDDYTNSLKYAIPVLQKFEVEKDTFGIIRSLLVIGGVFAASQNYEQGLVYYNKCLAITKGYNDRKLYSYCLNSLADCLNKMNLPDSALPYAQEALRVGQELKDTFNLAATIGTLGETYIARGEHDIARPFLQQALHYSKKYNQRFTISYTLNDFAQSFFETGQYDSSLSYARQALYYAHPNYKSLMMTAYEWEYKNFEKQGSQDSVYKYFRLAMDTKDELFTIEKTRNIQSLDFQEQMRQQEVEAEKLLVASDRKKNIQMAFIAVGLITFIILYLILSRRFITNTKLIIFLGVIALLMVFEFLNLLLHPFLEKITHHIPVLMLLALVSIAAILVPLHHRIEKWATQKLVEKNKKIRLAAAKKTIARLEGEREGMKNEE
jgi:tetratricopeptide (TPR) repeat protein